MTNPKDKQSPQETMSELHRLIGMTPSQVRQDLIDQGLDPASEIHALRRLGRVLSARYAAQIEKEAALPSEFLKPFQIFDEAVAAGAPIWAEVPQSVERSSILAVLRQSDTDAVIMAKVKGWSMRDEGINDGDVVLVDTKAEARSGDIVLAHIAGQGQVVKRLLVLNGKIILESANPDFAPIEISDASTLRVHGVVIGRAGVV